MGLVGDIESALADVADALPDAALEMRLGGASGTVLSVSSIELSGDSVSGEMPQERRRVIAARSDFPDIAEGSLVELDGVPHITTTIRTDPVAASVTIGLSKPLTECAATCSATRRVDGAPRTLKFPLDILAVENAALPNLYGDAPAPNIAQSWTLCAAVESWPEDTPPQTGDEIAFTLSSYGENADLRLRVSQAVRNHGWWILTARPRGGA